MLALPGGVVVATTWRCGTMSTQLWAERQGLLLPGSQGHAHHLLDHPHRHTHAGLRCLTGAPRAALVTWRRPVAWYASVWAHLGRQIAPMRHQGPRSLPWTDWLAWALAPSPEAHPVSMPPRRCRRTCTLYRWTWERMALDGQGRPLYDRILWLEQVASRPAVIGHYLGRTDLDLDPLPHTNRPRLDLPVVTPEQVRRIDRAEAWRHALY